jgi:lycopene beta-cyclase
MSYLTFLGIFLLIPILLLLAVRRGPTAGVGGLRARLAIPALSLIAFAYTTPWDNYLVYRGVWFYGTDRVLATIGYVPIEEYAFFILQPILTGLFLYRVLERYPMPELRPAPGIRIFGSLVFAAFAVGGFLFLLSGNDRALYMGLILSWACPILLVLWAYAGDHISEFAKPTIIAVVVPTLYLWVADRIAIGLGIWDISALYSFNWRPLGLPIEEAVFFLVTNTLVVIGVQLFLHGDRIATRRNSVRNISLP